MRLLRSLHAAMAIAFPFLLEFVKNMGFRLPLLDSTVDLDVDDIANPVVSN